MIQNFDEIVPTSQAYSQASTELILPVLGWSQDGATNPPVRVSIDFSDTTLAFQHRITSDRRRYYIERMDVERDVFLDYSPDDDAPGENDQDIPRSLDLGHKRAIFAPWWFRTPGEGVHLTPLKEIHWFAFGTEYHAANSAAKSIISRLDDPWGIVLNLQATSYTDIQANPDVRPVIEAWRIRGTVEYHWDA